MKPTQMDLLMTAREEARAATSALQEALRGADATTSLVLLPLIQEAADLSQRIDMLRMAIVQDTPMADDATCAAAGIPDTPWPIPATRAALKSINFDLSEPA